MYPTLSLNDKGPAVRRLQELGDFLGFDSGKNDGLFGPVTRRIVTEIQQSLGLCQDGICGPATWSALLNAVDHRRSLVSILPCGLHDISGAHLPPRNFAYLRAWESIVGVVLHQTGCAMPSNPIGWQNVNAHYGITQEGIPILINRPEDMIWHAQGLSKLSIGIEIEGNFEGVEGLAKTLWAKGGGPHFLTDLMIKAAGIIFDNVMDRFTSNGQKWRSVWAHRQSAKSRRGDPGSEIWQKIAKPWIFSLNCSKYEPRTWVGAGRPIPTVWDSNGKGAY